MLTALDSEADAVLGLEAGADDYVDQALRPGRAAQPHPRRAAPRRPARARRRGAARGPAASSTAAAREVSVAARPVQLTFSEFEVLAALMAAPGRLFNRQELLRAIWGDSAYRDPRGIDVHIRHLREKLEAVPGAPASCS